MKKLLILLIILLIISTIPQIQEYLNLNFLSRLNINFLNFKESSPELELPALVIMYDDANIEDYTRAFPVHQEYQVPAVTAVNPDYIGKRNKLKREQLYSLAAAGWEIASHGYNHTALIYNSVTGKLEPGDKKIPVKNGYFVNKDYTYRLFNSASGREELISIKEVIPGNKDFIKLKHPVSRSYPQHRTYITLSEKAMEKEIIDSKRKLEHQGFKVKSFAYPYNGFNTPSVSMVEKHYQIARGGRKIGEEFPDTFINTRPISRYKLKGVCFENNLLSPERLDILLEETLVRKGLLVLYAHTSSEHFQKQRLQKIIEFAQKKGIKIVTLQEIGESFKFQNREN